MNISDFLLQVRQAAMIPDTGSLGGTDADLLKHADDALTSLLLPRMINSMEDYYTLRERTPVVAGTTSYRIPRRASFNKLRAIYFLESATAEPIRMIKLDPEELPPTSGGGTPLFYRFENNRIFLVPDDEDYSGFLEFVYHQSPGTLVTAANARQILTIDPGTRTVTFSSAVPTGWSTATRFDIHSDESGAELLLNNALASSVAGSTIIFDAGYPLDGSLFGSVAPQIGDFVVLSGTAAAPVLPAELHHILARATALHFANSIGDKDMASLHERLLSANLKDAGKTIESRNESDPIRLGRQGSIMAGFRYRPRHSQ